MGPYGVFKESIVALIIRELFRGRESIVLDNVSDFVYCQADYICIFEILRTF